MPVLIWIPFGIKRNIDLYIPLVYLLFFGMLKYIKFQKQPLFVNWWGSLVLGGFKVPSSDIFTWNKWPQGELFWRTPLCLALSFKNICCCICHRFWKKLFRNIVILPCHFKFWNAIWKIWFCVEIWNGLSDVKFVQNHNFTEFDNALDVSTEVLPYQA